MAGREIYRSAFEEKLIEQGFDFRCGGSITTVSYILIRKDKVVSLVQLVGSESIDRVMHESNNGNKIQAIGSFKFRLMNDSKEPAFFIFGFQNTPNQRIDFVIIPNEELKRRLVKKNRNSTACHRISIVFWLMDERFLYDCSGVGAEWEWFYLSRGVNGRMADGSVWDYSEFLNDWDRLTMK